MQKKVILRKKILELNLDGILITDLTNLRYLTGFTGSSGFLIITSKHAIFVTDFRYREQAKQEVKGFTIKIERADRADEIRQLLNKYRIKKLGFEDHNVSYRLYKELSRNKIKLKPLTDVVESLRFTKSEKELSCIKTAIRRAETAFKRLQPFIKAGTTEQKLAMRLEGFLKEEGCKNIPFGVIVASGSMSAFPHAKPTNRTLKAGDLVIFDWGGECDGYYSDMTRTVVLKNKNMEKHKELYSIVLEAQAKAMKTVKSGIKATLIDATVRNYIKQKGYGNYFGHGTGHGIGLAVHERPVISERSKDIIREGMVFTIEPGIYIPGFGGVRIEDMVVVKKNRTEILTTLPRGLKIIG
jgi:Xaa-Pro aminopeptidase